MELTFSSAQRARRKLFLLQSRVIQIRTPIIHKKRVFPRKVRQTFRVKTNSKFRSPEMRRIRNYTLGILIFGTALFAGSLPLRYVHAEVDTSPLSSIRPTPPAPVFDQAKRLEELAARRKRVAEAIGSKSILVMFSAQSRVYANDVDYQFRQENNLYYLTNLNQSGSALVMMPGNSVTREILYVPRRNAQAETWTRQMYSPEEVAQLSGIKEIWDAGEFENFVKAVRSHQSYRPKPANILMSERSETAATTNTGFESLFSAVTNNEASLYLITNFPREAESKEYRQEQVFAAAWKDSGFKIQNVFPIFAQMRVYKSPMELELLQHAIDISIEAHQR